MVDGVGMVSGMSNAWVTTQQLEDVCKGIGELTGSSAKREREAMRAEVARLLDVQRASIEAMSRRISALEAKVAKPKASVVDLPRRRA
jgi:hypothetical protein